MEELNYIFPSAFAAPSPSGQCLQYAFFHDRNSNFYPCDDASRDFWESVGEDAVLPYVESLKLSSVTSCSTIIIQKACYLVRLIPIGEGNIHAGHLVILQNQALFSTLITEIEPLLQSYEADALDAAFARISSAVILVDTANTIRYISPQYNEASGRSREDLIGRTMASSEKDPFVSSIISPMLSDEQNDFSILHTLSTGRLLVISRATIRHQSGDAACTLIFSSLVTHPLLSDTGESLISTAALRSMSKNASSTQINIVAKSSDMQTVIADVLRVANYDVPLLILGESGTGKEVVANLLHYSSRSRHGKFVKINCSALTSSLLETELFGYEPGAFTGALARGKMGLFEEASDGTVLLDEIGDMPLPSQAKLLRVLQEGEIYRVGGVKPIKINARVIASTNRDLREMVEKQTFRQDLYHRLNVIPISIPSLRDRKDDIIPIIMHYAFIFNKKYSLNKTFSSELLQAMLHYTWPGNTRELRNTVERLMLVSPGDTLTPEDFYSKYPNARDSAETSDALVSIPGMMLLEDAINLVEQKLIQRAVEQEKSSRAAAKLLGISQSTLVRKAAAHSISLRK